MAQGVAVAKVAMIAGEAFAKTADGKTRVLHVGDVVRDGEQIVTSPGGRVELAFDDGSVRLARIGEAVHAESFIAQDNPEPARADNLQGDAQQRAEQVIAQGGDLDELLDDPAAAGNDAGSGANNSHDFVRLGRISETVGGVDFEFPSASGTVRSTLSDDGERRPLLTSALTGNEASVAPPNTGGRTNVTAGLSAGSDSGVPGDGLTNDATPTITGTGAPGATISVVTPTGETLTTTVAPNGTWSVTPTAVVPDGTGNFNVTATDSLGNSATTTVTVTVDTVAAASISLAPVTADNVINAVEAGGTVSVTGSVGGDAKLGDTVTLTIGGNSYTGTVGAGNTFAIDVPGSVLAGNSSIGASVTASDAAGNSATASASQAYSVDTSATAGVTINGITADNVINAAESGGPVAITGTVGGDAKVGDTVTLTIGANTYTGTVAAGNTYSINVPGAVLAANSAVGASVTATDAAGNAATASANHPYAVDTSATATITVASITADNIINATEAGGTVAVTGTVGGDAKVGDIVTLTVGGNTYTGTVAAGNTYSINIPGSVLATNSTVSASVSATDAAGNSTTANANHPYSVDTTASASITIASITADNVINAAESGGPVAVTGTVGGDAKVGDTVTLTVGGNSYTGTVAAGNTYSINVPGAVLAANSTVGASVTATDSAGNSTTVSANHPYSVDTTASASITIASITADNVINAAESGGPVAITGTVGGDAKVGDTVALTVGANTYTGTVAAGNTYSINVPGSVLATNSAVSASVTATDPAGNSTTANANHPYSVDLNATATITIASITADNVINAAESGGPVAVTGTVGGDAKLGDTVTLTVGANSYTGTVVAGNTYSINVPGAVLAANSTVGASVTATDSAGNSTIVSANHPYSVDTSATATITVASITADNIVNATEAGGTVAVTGTVGGDAKVGDTVTLTVGGNSYTGTVAAGNTYSINVSGAVLAANTTVDASVVATDAAGNTASASTNHPYAVDTSATAAITVASITADNIINAAESVSTIAVTGSVGGDAKPGDTVTLTIGTSTYTGTVAADNTYSINVPGSVLATNTSVDAVVTTTDTAGNPAMGTANHPYAVDTSAAASITIASITADNVINAAESGGPVAVTGTVGGDAKVGDTVTLTVGASTYTGTVALGNTYSINVPGSVLAGNSTVGASVTTTDAAGNPATGTASHPYSVDLNANATITIASITADNIINAAESVSTVAVTGTVGGDAKVGDTVTLTVGGYSYTSMVAAGNTYSINVPGSVLAGNSTVNASVTTTDAAGNTATGTANHPYSVDTTASASITIASITADNVINVAESGGPVAVTGSVGGDAKPGDTVTLTIGANTYTGTVAAGNTYSIDVPGVVLAANSNVQASVAATDTAGNSVTATSDHAYASVLAATATIQLDSVTADNIVNLTESSGSIAITGTAGGVAQPGDTVTLTIGGNTYSGSVLPGNTFSINVPGGVLAANAQITASVTGLDAFGNPATGTDTQAYAVDLAASASITVDAITPDNIVNAAESASTIAVTGTVGGDAKVGDTVTLTIGSNTYTGTVVIGNTYSIDVPGAVLAANTAVTASVAASDFADNTTSASATHPYSVDGGAAASITIAAITADNIINATEAGGPIAVTGTVGGDAKVGDTVTLTVGANSYTGTVAAGNIYSINVPGAVLAANTTVAASLTATDAAGNSTTVSANHPYGVDTSATATITVASITADNIVNATEAGTSIAVTGTVGGDAKAGDTATLTIGANTYTGTVAVGNTYSINVPGAVLAANTTVAASVTTADGAGNTVTANANHLYTVDTSATATITVALITADNIVNATEAGTTIAVTGTVGGDAKLGDTVTLTVGASTYTGPVAAGNTYSINVPGSVLAANSTLGASVTATDAAGNTATGTANHPYAVDTSATASIMVASITADNVINAAESGGPVAVTGTVGGDAKLGDTVTLTVGGNTYTGTVAAGNTYSINVLGSVLAGNSTVGASVTATDAAGNTATASANHPYTVDTSAAATITVASITADNIVNATEAGGTVAVTGTVGGDAKVGDTVTLTVGGNSYTGTVAAGNTYSINVPGSVLAGNSTVNASVAATDAAGNSTTASANHPYSVDLNANATITIVSITADNVINAAESGGPVAVTGTVGGDAKVGDTVTLTIGTNTYIGTVAVGNTYSINVPGSVLAGNSTVNASVSATDVAGNSTTASANHPYSVDTTASASITIASITADNVINAAESGGPVAITGTVGGDAKVGDTVTLTIGANTYTGTVVAGNTYSINVPGAVLAANSAVGASVTATDAAGNAATASANHPYAVDTSATATITVASITADNIINATEAGGTVAVTGTVGGDAKVGDTVTLIVGANSYTGTVAAGNTYSINVPGAVLAANSIVGASVTATDAAGNTASANANHPYAVDTSATAAITVASITADNIVNATEAGTSIAVTGTVGGDAKVGDTVTLTIGANTYTGTVAAGNTYSINVSGAVLAANSAVGASVTATDAAGNTATASTNHPYAVDTSATASITVASITADNIVNAAESGGPVAVTGTVGGDAKVGDAVTLTVGGNSYTGTVAAGNTYSINVPGSVLAGNSTVGASVTATDSAGNSTTANVNHPYSVDTTASASITIASITADNVINAAESGGPVAVTGSVGGDAKVGDTVTLTIGTNTYIGAVAVGNTYSINVPGSALAGNSTVNASVSATDVAGNSTTASANHPYSVDLNANATITIASITADNVINAAESGGPVAVTGTVGGDAKLGDTVTLTVGTNTYTGTVAAGNTYSINVPGAVLAANSAVGASVTATDAVGNTATASANHPYTVDTSAAATITVASITADNIVNAAESGGPVAITGTVGGDAKVGDTVTLTIGGNTYTGMVAAGNTYSINVPGAVLAANTTVAASVTAIDAAGNTATASTNHPYSVDTTASASITIASITADNVINAAESGGPVAVTGTVGGDAKLGDTVTLTVGGNSYTGTVAAGNTYSINVPGSVLVGNSTVGASVTATDAAGNTATGTANHPYTVDTTAPSASIDLANTVASDTGVSSVDNITSNVRPVITGTGEPNRAVTIVVDPDNNAATTNSVVYTTTTNASGAWSVDLQTAVPVSGALPASGLPNGTVGLSVTSTDAAGNTTTAINTFVVTHPLAVNDAAAATEAGGLDNGTPGINPSGNLLTNDTGISRSVTAITGTSAGTIGGTTGGQYGTLSLDAAGNYSYTVNNGSVAVNALKSGQSLSDVFTYTMTDAGGATSTATLTVTVNGANDAPAAVATTVTATEDTAYLFNLANFTFTDPEGDAAASINIASLPANGTLQFFNGTAWVAVAAGTSIAVSEITAGHLRFVPAANESGGPSYATSGLGDQHQHYARFSFSVTDTAGTAGNTATATIDVTAMADAPTLSVSNVASQLFRTGWETAVNSDNTSQAVATTTLEGWTRVDTPNTGTSPGNNAFEVWNASTDTMANQSGSQITPNAASGGGNQWLELNDATNGTNPQTIGIQRTVSTVAGDLYSLTFDYAGREGYTSAYTRIGVYVNGTLIAQYADTSPQTSLNWQTIQFSFVGTGNDTILIRTDATSFDAGGRGAQIDEISLSQYHGAIAGNAVGGTKTDISLGSYVSALFPDSDGSESHTLTFGNLPTSAVIVSGANTYTAVNGSITISESELASAKLELDSTVLGNFSLSVSGNATETADGSAASSAAQTLNLTVVPSASGNASDTIVGGVANETIIGDARNETLMGGIGNDTLIGGGGADTFRWTLGDAGPTGSPARDTVTDFSTANYTGSGAGDRLDLRDLLVGESHSGTAAGNLSNFLHFERVGSDTVIHVNTAGGYSGGFNAASDNQVITLQGVNLVGSFTTDQQIIQDLLTKQKLVVD